jgi:hypothetical protein
MHDGTALNEIAILNFGEYHQTANRKTSVKDQFENIDYLISQLSRDHHQATKPNCATCGHNPQICEFL